ncbi:MAG: hypothetical protein WCJ19_05490 [bacterium]
MKLILLGGNSKYNKDWIEKVELALSDIFDTTYIQYYEHWLDDSKKGIDLEIELKKLKEYVKDTKDYMIFAKSAGSILTVKGCVEKVIRPERCVFTGFAYPWAMGRKIDIDNLLRNYFVPTMFIQESKDPALSYKQLTEIIYKLRVPNTTMQEIPGNDHNYEDIEKLKELIQNYINL